MNLFPQASGTRPRVACEIMPQGVVAARSADASSPIAAVARIPLADGAIAPSLKPSNIVDRVAVAAALRNALEQIGIRPSARGSGGADVALVIPDSAVRVLLLDFEALPSKLTEALPLVRFRLKKLLPFDADDAMVTFQVMSTSRTIVRVLAVAIPRDVLSEYETAVREAGFEPGAVLPSTLACLAAVDDAEPTLLVNANSLGLTVAIIRAGILLLHRSVDLQQHAPLAPLADPLAPTDIALASALPLVNVEDSAGEWAAQEALPEHGRNPYADRIADEAAVQDFDRLPLDPDPIVDLPAPGIYVTNEPLSAILNEFAANVPHIEPEAHPLSAEIAQAVSVAAAYFEDTLAVAPTQVLSAGPLGADQLRKILVSSGVGDEDGLHVRELVESASLLPDAVTAAAPRPWLSGVLGALKG